MINRLFIFFIVLLPLELGAQFNVTDEMFSKVYNNVTTRVYDDVYLEYMQKSTQPYLGEFIFNVSFPVNNGLDSLYGVTLFELDKGFIYFFDYAGDPVEGSNITMHEYSSYPIHIYESEDESWQYLDSGVLTYYTRGPENYMEIKIGPIILEYRQ